VPVAEFKGPPHLPAAPGVPAARHPRRPVLRALVRDRAGSALLTLLLAGILILEFGSLQILYPEENAPDAKITTASDALWYTIVTISTVGYGDQYPVTNAGRVVGTLIVVVGVGIFGTFTGYLANAFLAPRRRSGEESGATDRAVPVAADGATTRDLETLDELRELVTRRDVSLAEVGRLLAQRRAEEA
jgi:voltage-gated potassium channel Kch